MPNGTLKLGALLFRVGFSLIKIGSGSSKKFVIIASNQLLVLSVQAFSLIDQARIRLDAGREFFM